MLNRQQQQQHEQQQQRQHTNTSFFSTAQTAGPMSAQNQRVDGGFRSGQKGRRTKRKTQRACNHCQRSHLTCNDSRPCARCQKRGLADTCVDGARKKAKYLIEGSPQMTGTSEGAAIGATVGSTDGDSQDQRQKQPPAALNAAGAAPLETATQRGTPLGTSFGSEAISLEHAILMNMLACQVSGNVSALGSPADGTTRGPISTITIPNSLWAAPALLPPMQSAGSIFDGDGLGIATNGSAAPGSQGAQAPHVPWPQTPHSSSGLHGTGLAFPVTGQSPRAQQHVVDEMHHPLRRAPSGPAVHGLNPVYLQAPGDVYSAVVEPYKYNTGFHFLFKYISGRMGRRDILRVSRAIAHFRPSLVALLRNLTREDLVFMEKSFQRAMLEYEKLIGFVGTPTVVWRRTGEIALVGKEFSILTQWDRQELVATNRFIFELMDAESAVVYWEQFAVHAFENSEHAVMSECRLVRPDGSLVPCAFSFTIKRDLFGIPMAIIGNFLPIL
ncbi:Transcriptional regulator of nonfermentable carbon utilization [Coemansia sp. RSA 1365]|nr:Transcriptional regulator of nonfermentable carbon utilization [Coemansia sp. RSA 1365]